MFVNYIHVYITKNVNEAYKLRQGRTVAACRWPVFCKKDKCTNSYVNNSDSDKYLQDYLDVRNTSLTLCSHMTDFRLRELFALCPRSRVLMVHGYGPQPTRRTSWKL